MNILATSVTPPLEGEAVLRQRVCSDVFVNLKCFLMPKVAKGSEKVIEPASSSVSRLCGVWPPLLLVYFLLASP